jgi:hypothetical protein
VYVDIVKHGDVTGDVIALQIKGGEAAAMPFLAQARTESSGAQAPSQCSAWCMTPASCNQARAYLRADGPPALVDLAASDPLRQRAAVLDAFGLARNDVRPLLLLRSSLRYMRDRAALAPAIRVLTLTVGHGDVFWTADNWLPDAVCEVVRGELRWSVAEAEQLIAVTEPEEWCRGGLGQDVHALLDADATPVGSALNWSGG